jgi:putative inorganic carbon (HCO3(-)) transporter
VTDSHKYVRPDMSRLRHLACWATYLPSPHPLGRVTDAAILTFVAFSTVSITVAQGAILLALLTWLAALVWSQHRRRLYLPLILPMAAFFLASVLATAMAVDPYRSFGELRNFFLPAFFFVVVNHLSEEKRAISLTHVLIFVGGAMALYGLSQSFAQGEAFRIRGTMSIWMTFAGLMMLLATVSLAHLLFTPDPRLAVRLIPALLVLMAALVMTHTRGAWLGFAVGAAFILACRKRLFLVLLPILLLAIFIAAPQTVRDRMRSIVDPQDVTARERLYMWGSGLQMIRDRPWTGVGLDGVKGVYPAYRDPRASGARWGHLHNNVIQVAVERGLIGLVCWLWLWAAFYGAAWRLYRALPDDAGHAKALVVGGLAAVSAFHVEGMFEYTFGDSEVIALLYFLMALSFLAGRRGANDHDEARATLPSP